MRIPSETVPPHRRAVAARAVSHAVPLGGPPLRQAPRLGRSAEPDDVVELDALAVRQRDALVSSQAPGHRVASLVGSVV
jgi:hypothetical protein